MEDRSVSISISLGTIIKTILLVVGLWLLYHLRDFVLVVITAIVIASAIEPGVSALIRRKLPRLLSVIAVYISLFAGFFLAFYFFLPTVLEELASFLSTLPTYLEAFTRAGAFDGYSRFLGTVAPSTVAGGDIIQSVREILNVNGVFSSAFKAASSIFGGVFSFILIIVFSFYFAVLETGIDDFLRIVSPVKYQKYVLDLWRRSQHKIGLWMQGQLVLAIIIGVLVFLGLTILGVKHALLLAIIAAVFELIPVFGPILAAVPAVIIGFVDGGASLGFLTIALYVIVQQFENHLIYPLVVTRVVGVPPLLVILALIVGAKLAGFLGILLSVPAAGAIQELVKDIESGRTFADKEKD